MNYELFAVLIPPKAPTQQLIEDYRAYVTQQQAKREPAKNISQWAKEQGR